MGDNIDLNRLSITNRLIVKEANSRSWQVKIVDYEKKIMFLEPERGPKMLFSGVKGPFSKATDSIIADNKGLAYEFAKKAGLNLPETEPFVDIEQANNFLEQYKTVVVKPLDQGHGNGVTVAVDTKEKLITALEEAKKFSSNITLQKHIKGDDLRLLYIGKKLTAACIRRPAEVTGDGEHTIAELIDIENKSGRRAEDYKMPLNYIDVQSAQIFLGSSMGSVPEVGEVVRVVGVANIGRGGSSIDITDELEKEIEEQGKKLVDLIGMDIAGVDFIYDQDSKKAYFIEVNAGPSFGLHVYPAVGQPRHVEKIFLDWVEEYSKKIQ